MTEVWKSIDNTRYDVSNMGNVRNSINGNLLKPCKNSVGYYQVTLYPQRKKIYVHRLVAHAFVDGYSDGLEVNHKDEDKSNNCAENLEWVTKSANRIYNGTVSRVLKKRLGKKVVGTYSNGGDVIFDTIREASLALGIKDSHISECCRGIRRTSGGLTWRWAE